MVMPAVGTLSYNGVTWDGYVQTRVSMKPVSDTAGRLTKAVEYTVHVVGWITGSATGDADTTLTTWRRLLTVRGGVLRFQSRGLGDIVVNSPAEGVWDMNHGPVPEILDWKPFGGAPGSPVTVYTEFTVKTVICPQPGRTGADLMELCYDINYAIDQDGLHTITVTGDLEIPIPGVQRFQLASNADAYRERLNFPTPVGFQRMHQEYKLSADRKFLTFNIVDKETPIPLPFGATMAEVRHTVSGARRNSSFTIAQNTIAGTVRMNPAWGKYNAYSRFIAIVSARIFWTRHLRAVARFNPQQAPAVFKTSPIIIDRFEAEEDLFSYTSRFSVTYLIMGTNLTDMLLVTGLWRPIPDFDFEGWTASLKNNAHHVRGNLRVAFDSARDTIVNACDVTKSTDNPQRPTKDLRTDGKRKFRTTTTNFKVPDPNPGLTGREDTPWQNARLSLRRPTPPPGTPGTIPLDLPSPLDDSTRPPPLNMQHPFIPGGRQEPSLTHPLSGSRSTIDPRSSWLMYDLKLEIVNDHRISRHQPLAGTISERVAGPDALGPVGPVGNDASPAKFPVSGNAQSEGIFQRTSAPVTIIRLHGMAARLGHEINPPRLERYEGKDVVLLHEQMNGGVVSSTGGNPIYGLVWELVYGIATPPHEHKMPANPLANISGDQATNLLSPLQG